MSAQDVAKKVKPPTPSRDLSEAIKRFPWLWAVINTWPDGWRLSTEELDLREYCVIGELWVKLSRIAYPEEVVLQVPDSELFGVQIARRIISVVPAGFRIEAVVLKARGDIRNESCLSITRAVSGKPIHEAVLEAVSEVASSD